MVDTPHDRPDYSFPVSVTLTSSEWTALAVLYRLGVAVVVATMRSEMAEMAGIAAEVIVDNELEAAILAVRVLGGQATIRIEDKLREQLGQAGALSPLPGSKITDTPYVVVRHGATWHISAGGYLMKNNPAYTFEADAQAEADRLNASYRNLPPHPMAGKKP